MSTVSLRTLHVVPGDSACGSLREALRSVGRDEDVLRFPDDLSCGPLDPDEPDVREAWWDYGEEGFVCDRLHAFWKTVEASEDRLVVWFSRHAAFDLSFFHHWVDRLSERSYDVLDVTGLRPAYQDREGQPVVARPLASVAGVPTQALPALLGTERALTIAERAKAGEHWRRLKAENAYFRVVTEGGLVSAPEDFFDASLLGCASRDWTKSARVVGECLSRNWEPYIQVSDMMLTRRLEALVEAGRLLVEGDVRHLRSSEIRLPD